MFNDSYRIRIVVSFKDYLILKESKYLYRNVRKKQKSDKNNNFKNGLFTKKIKEEIKTSKKFYFSK